MYETHNKKANRQDLVEQQKKSLSLYGVGTFSILILTHFRTMKIGTYGIYS